MQRSPTFWHRHTDEVGEQGDRWSSRAAPQRPLDGKTVLAGLGGETVKRLSSLGLSSSSQLSSSLSPYVLSAAALLGGGVRSQIEHHGLDSGDAATSPLDASASKHRAHAGPADESEAAPSPTHASTSNSRERAGPADVAAAPTQGPLGGPALEAAATMRRSRAGAMPTDCAARSAPLALKDVDGGSGPAPSPSTASGARVSCSAGPRHPARASAAWRSWSRAGKRRYQASPKGLHSK